MIENCLEVKAFKNILDNEISIKDFCEVCNLRVLDFFNICEGRYIPNLETALKISQVLGCPLESVFYLREHAERK